MPQPESSAEPTSLSQGPIASPFDQRLAEAIVRFRWPLSAAVVLGVAILMMAGVDRVMSVTRMVGGLGDTTSGAGAAPPIVFDPRMDVWFGAEDKAVDAYREIEDRFVAEDYVVVSFAASDEDEFGVFTPRHLDRIARLTEHFLQVPGVRHVRSLTYNPWIRWGTIEDEGGGEEGLLITDLVEGDPLALTDADVVERMVAVLGAQATVDLVGEARVREVVGDEPLENYIGEPLLLGTIVDPQATTTSIQIQVLRPRPDDEQVAASFDGDLAAGDASKGLWTIQMQRAALRGVRHYVGLELGTTVPAPGLAALTAYVESLPEGEDRERLQTELRDPSRNFMADGDGALQRKFFEYEPDGSGGWVDRSDPGNAVAAPDGWTPTPGSAEPVEFHIGGVPVFELNFESVGMEDGKYIPVMFLVIMVCLLVVFRHAVGVVAPIAVVFGSIAGMLGFAFAKGDLLNNLTMMSPNMLTAVGIADAVHLVAAWAMFRTKFDDKRELLVEVMRVNALPVLLTSITTAIGFYSLTASELIPVRMLGYTAGFGALLAYLLSMTLVPALLSLVPHKAAVPASRAWLSGIFTDARARGLVQRIVRRRAPILMAAGLVFVVSAVGVARIQINSDFREMFPDDNTVVSDFNWVESRLGGLGDVELIFRGAGGGGDAGPLSQSDEAELGRLKLGQLLAANDEGPALTPLELTRLAELKSASDAWQSARIGVAPEFLGALDRLERRLRTEMEEEGSALSVLSDLTSPLDILRKIHQVQNRNEAALYRVPTPEDVDADQSEARLDYDEFMEEWSLTPGQDARSLVAQYYLQYENGARPGENLSTQLSQDRMQFRMQGRMKQAPTLAHLNAFKRMEEVVNTEFPELDVDVSGAEARVATPGAAEMTVSGKTLLNARTMRLFSTGFVKSMTIALVMITIIIGLLFRSLALALVSLLPNVLPILLPLSAFGLLGVPLDGPAILVSSVALGVCVDDTIHFFTKFVRARRAGESMENALVYSMTQAGGALTITTIVLMIGFGTLLLSDFTPNFMMGTLATLMIALAWLLDFLVTPALLSLLPNAGRARPSA